MLKNGFQENKNKYDCGFRPACAGSNLEHTIELTCYILNPKSRIRHPKFREIT